MAGDHRIEFKPAGDNMENPLTGARIVDVITELDIVAARAAARKVAEAERFDMMDQIGISVATWWLLHALELGVSHRGQVAVDCLDSPQRRGMRVICTRQAASQQEITPKLFSDLRRLVDELSIETVSPGTTRVTIIKWAQQEHAPSQHS